MRRGGGGRRRAAGSKRKTRTPHSDVGNNMIQGNLEVKLPKNGQMKSRDGKSQRREEKKEEDQRREIQKKEDSGARKGRKVAIHWIFPMMLGSGGSKSRLAKAAGAEPAGQMRDGKLHAVVARSTFASEKAQKKIHVRTIFRSCDVEKVHAVVARSTFRSQNVQNASCSDHFWKLRCRKSARCCGAKHISKSKV